MYKALKTLILSAKEEFPLGTEFKDKDFKDKNLHVLFRDGKDFLYIEDEVKPKKKEIKDEKDSNAS
jgi:hypothetical protein